MSRRPHLPFFLLLSVSVSVSSLPFPLQSVTQIAVPPDEEQVSPAKETLESLDEANLDAPNSLRTISAALLESGKLKSELQKRRRRAVAAQERRRAVRRKRQALWFTPEDDAYERPSLSDDDLRRLMLLLSLMADPEEPDQLYDDEEPQLELEDEVPISVVLPEDQQTLEELVWADAPEDLLQPSKRSDLYEPDYPLDPMEDDDEVLSPEELDREVTLEALDELELAERMAELARFLGERYPDYSPTAFYRK